jgi:transcription initiation factor TFIIB
MCSIYCNSGRIVTDLESAEVVWESCGLVSPDEAIESHVQWTTFESDNGSNIRQRVGLPNSLAFHDMDCPQLLEAKIKTQLDTHWIFYVNSSMQRLRTWDARSWSNVSGHRNLMQAFNELGRLKDKLGLTNTIVEKVAYIYRKAEEKQIISWLPTASSPVKGVWESMCWM